VGLSEGIVLRHFHQDAQAVFNLVSSLEEVCVKLKDRTERFPRQVMYSARREGNSAARRASVVSVEGDLFRP
jgi:hypothetical protein